MRSEGRSWLRKEKLRRPTAIVPLSQKKKKKGGGRESHAEALYRKGTKENVRFRALGHAAVPGVKKKGKGGGAGGEVQVGASAQGKKTRSRGKKKK